MTMSKEPAGDDPRPADQNRPAGVPDAARPSTDDPNTHTAALQGAAAGGAASGSAGYATGLLTGSEDDIGMRDIPEPAPATRRAIDDRPPVAEGLPPGPPPEVARAAVDEIRAARGDDADVDADAGSITPGATGDPDLR